MVVPVRAHGEPALATLLGSHPFVRVESFEEASRARIEFDTGRPRVAYQGKSDSPLYGLTELMDNNPLVCADESSMTGPEATLALIALGPLAKAELLTEMPAIAFNFAAIAPEEVEAALETEGWADGAAVATSDDVPAIYRAECIAEIRMPGSEDDVRLLYDECFARSFLVRESGELPDGAHATYSIALEDRGDGTALAKVTASSLPDMKCGSGGLVHLFNVMCGFEESLGVSYSAAGATA